MSSYASYFSDTILVPMITGEKISTDELPVFARDYERLSLDDFKRELHIYMAEGKTKEGRQERLKKLSVLCQYLEQEILDVSLFLGGLLSSKESLSKSKSLLSPDSFLSLNRKLLEFLCVLDDEISGIKTGIKIERKYVG